MKIIIAKSAGFCWGVKRAVDKARSLATTSQSAFAKATADKSAFSNPHLAIPIRQSPIHTDGPLIHNKEMIAQLRSEGIIEAKNLQSLSSGYIIVRAHGIPPNRRAMLKKLPLTLIDATCPDVAKIQGLIKKYANKGYHIIIFGDPGHAEVTGLLGYTNNKGFVVNQTKDIKNLPDMKPVCLVSQSTQFPASYKKIADAVQRRFAKAEILDTICESTKNRQRELLKIARIVDAIIVVGGSHSANTVRLVQLAKTLKPTFHIQTSNQINSRKLRNFKTIGLTAGASTPAFIIEDIKNKLEKM